MLEAANSTRGKLATVPVTDRDGRDYLAAILQYSYRVDANGKVEELGSDAPDIDLVDTYNGKDPATSSIRRPSMLFAEKPGTDVVLLGHAYPAKWGGHASVDVELRVGPINKSVRAFGLRAWQKGTFGGLAPGPAIPIRDPVPLLYELAWGGQDLSDPQKPLGESRNYVGRGVTRSPKNLVGAPAAQLERPDASLRTASEPVCFGPIHRHWQPRMKYAGTYDERWERTRMPLLPEDFDSKFNVCVPDDQWCSIPLRGNEVVHVSNATPEGRWTFALPRRAPGFSSVVRGKRCEHPTHLDTVLIDADEHRVDVFYRAAVRLPRKWQMLDRVLAFEKKVV